MSTDTPPPPAGREWPPTDVPHDEPPAPHRDGADITPPPPVPDAGEAVAPGSPRRYLMVLGLVVVLAAVVVGLLALS